MKLLKKVNWISSDFRQFFNEAAKMNVCSENEPLKVNEVLSKQGNVDQYVNQRRPVRKVHPLLFNFVFFA